MLADFWQEQGGVQDFVRWCVPGGVRSNTVNLDPLTGRFFRDERCKSAYKARDLFFISPFLGPARGYA